MFFSLINVHFLQIVSSINLNLLAQVMICAIPPEHFLGGQSKLCGDGLWAVMEQTITAMTRNIVEQKVVSETIAILL